jgi:hypothetical protein
MGKNTRPMLTALMDGDKLQHLRDYARERDVSMGWLINRLVDRLLAGDIEVMGEHSSTGVTRESIEQSYIDLTGEDIEKIVKTSIDLERERLEEMMRVYIDKERERVDETIESYIGNRKTTSIDNSILRADLERAIAPIERAIEELRGELLEVSKFTLDLQTQIAKGAIAVADGKPFESTSPTKSTQMEPHSPIPTPRELSQTTSSSSMTWAEFHRHVGLEPPSNKEKTKPNSEIALAKAIEMGITGWRFDSTTKKFIPHTPSQPEQTNQH